MVGGTPFSRLMLFTASITLQTNSMPPYSLSVCAFFFGFWTAAFFLIVPAPAAAAVGFFLGGCACTALLVIL